MNRQGLTRIAFDCVIFLIAVVGTYTAKLADRPITAVLIFLTGVILIAFRSGLASGLTAAIAASIIYNFFLSEPTFRFGFTTADEAVPLLAFNVSAILAGVLVGRLKDSARRAYDAQSETAFLLTVSDRLQSAVKVEDVEAAIRSILPRQSVRSVEIFLTKGKGYVRPSTGDKAYDPLKPFLDETEMQTDFGRPIILELAGARGVLGLVKFRHTETVADRDLIANLQSVAALLALAVERCLLLEEVAETRVAARSESLKDALLSSVSHDLRTPVTVIQAAAEALRSSEVRLSENQREAFVSSIVDQCRRLDRYTAELLDVGQIQSGITPDQLEILELNEIVRLAIKHAKAAHPSIEIKWRLPQGAVYVRANGAMLEQAIYNVIDNAHKFGGDRAPISLELSSNDTSAMIFVTDSGPGIFEDDKDHVFSRFFKSGSIKGNHGMGLGLFITRGFVEAFSGTIAIDSPAIGDRGTRVSIQFPLAEVCEEMAALQ